MNDAMPDELPTVVLTEPVTVVVDPPRIVPVEKQLCTNAREAALQAVCVYNDPVAGGNGSDGRWACDFSGRVKLRPDRV
jgi:hypothetical protein